MTVEKEICLFLGFFYTLYHLNFGPHLHESLYEILKDIDNKTGNQRIYIYR